MMKLFDIIPDKFFSLLNSKNRVIYMESLFIIYNVYREELIISKTDIISRIIAELEDGIMNIEIEEDDNEVFEANLSGTAHFLLRKLEKTGWIEKEFSGDTFDEYITLPEYSIKLLSTFHELMDDRPREYNSYVYSTYSVLRTANMERDAHTYSALIQAHKSAKDLVQELKTLLNNIRRYHQNLSLQESIREILVNHFDQFKETIADKIYHPLKTLDSVPRFKNPILKILKEWMMDEALKESISEMAIIRKHAEDKEEARQRITIMIGETIDIYERIEALVEEIDKKNAGYTRASTEKLRYLLNVDQGIRGKLINILKLTSQENEDIIEKINENINTFVQRFIDENSLYSPPKRRQRMEYEPLKLESKLDSKEIKKEFEDFINKVKKGYSHTKVMDFMKAQIASRKYINTSDLIINNDNDFILLILGVIKHDENTF